MGEMADDLINGFACSWCGTYFEEEHGYPVVCRDCAKGATKKELFDLGLQVATEDEI